MSDEKQVRALFVVNAMRPHSGAEIVLADYLRANEEVEAHVLLIGSDLNAVATFRGVLPEERIHFIFSNSFRDNKLTRFFLMPLEIRRQERFLTRGGQAQRLLDDRHFDVIVFNNSLEAALFSGLFADQNSVTYIHDMMESLRPATKYCVLRACRRIPTVITVSNACKTDLIRFGVAESKIRVIYNGLNERQAGYEPAENRRITVGFVGAITKRKGFDVCVEIVNRLAKRHPGEVERLLVATRSPADAYFHKCVDRLEGSVKLDVRRDVPRDQVLGLYRRMSFVLVPSRHDPLPTVVMEAISQGVPVIGSDADGIPEMIRERRLIFPVDQVEAALECIGSWLEMPRQEKVRVMRENQDYISALFSSDAKAKSLNGLLHDKVDASARG